MGPVVAVTFGYTIKDWTLVKIGLVSEGMSIILCVSIGLILGLVFVPFGPEPHGWMTDEIRTRGTLAGLISGVLVAIPSGLGVALSILGNNSTSLVVRCALILDS